ncbi:alkaline-phosphatase-like protein [Pelagophyceae sp. CCMP2097]|nr:alkaline-phosphatase-like protein [Pelagophyceae sp. CCMP2097]
MPMKGWQVSLAFAAHLVCRGSVAAQPHIVMVLADDLGYNNVGFHSDAPEVATPHLDVLAATGVRLERHYAYKFCTPARASLLSGRSLRDPAEANAGVPYNMSTFPEVLRAAGYKTHVIGKWDAGMATPRHSPKGRGFDDALIYWGHKNDMWTYKSVQSECAKVGGLYANLTDLWEGNSPAFETVSTALRNGAFEEDIFRNRLLATVAVHDANKPLFLLYAPHAAHCPLQVPYELYEASRRVVAASAAGDEASCAAQTAPPAASGIYPGFDGNYSCRAVYAASVALLDGNVGSLVASLEGQGLWSTTLLVFQSDNGGCLQLTQSAASNHPLRGGKASDWEGGQRVVALAAGGLLPQRARGTILRTPTHVADWSATFCALAGAPFVDDGARRAGLPPVDGRNLWPLLVGNATLVHADVALSSQALLFGADLKLVLGKQPFASLVGEAFPNATSPNNDPEPVRLPPPGLYNVTRDASESLDLAAERPRDLAEALRRMEDRRPGFYENQDAESEEATICAQKPAGVKCNPAASGPPDRACFVAVEHYGGFLGPFQQVDF